MENAYNHWPSFLPFGIFWVVFNSLINAAKFMNEIRNAIILNKIDDYDLKRAMYLDWHYSLIGILSACLIFSGLILRLSYILKSVAFELIAIACVPLFGALLFSLCGISDRQAMKKSMMQSKERELNQSGQIHETEHQKDVEE